MTDIGRLDLNLLLLLDGLLESENLSATARRLGISQPNASAGLAKLRYFFRDDLFVRTGRGLRATPFAHDLAQPVRTVVETISHEILRRPKFDPFESEREFVLMMPDLGEIIFLPGIVSRLHEEAPRARVRCVNVAYADLQDALEEGTIDLALGNYPDLLEPAMKSQKLYDDPMVCIARQGHPAIDGALPPQDFLKLDHLIFEREGRQALFEDKDVDAQVKRRALLQVPHFTGIPRLVWGSDMVAVVPCSLARLLGHQYDLQIFEPPFRSASTVVSQYWHRRMQSDPAVAWLRGIISDELAGTGVVQPPRWQSL